MINRSRQDQDRLAYCLFLLAGFFIVLAIVAPHVRSLAHAGADVLLPTTATTPATHAAPTMLEYTTIHVDEYDTAERTAYFTYTDGQTVGAAHAEPLTPGHCYSAVITNESILLATTVACK